MPSVFVVVFVFVVSREHPLLSREREGSKEKRASDKNVLQWRLVNESRSLDS